ncbi:hypothetical protein KM043_011640 [Ampulex compressa]|nr:hypothetical protein KM043_011640 [Ampulex compressa]
MKAKFEVSYAKRKEDGLRDSRSDAKEELLLSRTVGPVRKRAERETFWGGEERKDRSTVERSAERAEEPRQAAFIAIKLVPSDARPKERRSRLLKKLLGRASIKNALTGSVHVVSEAPSLPLQGQTSVGRALARGPSLFHPWSRLIAGAAMYGRAEVCAGTVGLLEERTEEVPAGEVRIRRGGGPGLGEVLVSQRSSFHVCERGKAGAGAEAPTHPPPHGNKRKKGRKLRSRAEGEEPPSRRSEPGGPAPGPLSFSVLSLSPRQPGFCEQGLRLPSLSPGILALFSFFPPTFANLTAPSPRPPPSQRARSWGAL